MREMNRPGRGAGLSINPGNPVESSFDLHTHTDNRGMILLMYGFATALIFVFGTAVGLQHAVLGLQLLYEVRASRLL